MDIVLLILLLLFSIVIILMSEKYKKKYNKYKFYIYLILVVLILFLCFLLKTKTKTKINQKGGRLTKIQKLRKKCGLPDDYIETSHCFNDSTHHTCCMLGPNTRKGVGNTRNRIGKPAERAYMKKHNLSQNEFDKIKDKISVPWCTCSGSSVCSMYKDIHGDTEIKFINDPTSENIVESPLNECEKYYRDKFNILQHRTPDVPLDLKKIIKEKCNKKLTKI